MLIFKHTVSYKLCLAISLVVTCLGAIVLFGWYTHRSTLIQVHPSLVPMQYNTALGFLLAGLSLLASLLLKHKCAVLLGLIVTCVGGTTLAQYILSIDLSVDQLFMQHYITTLTTHPGRMAPNTALCFFWSGTILCLVNISKRFQFLTALGPVVTALGAVALLGYVSGIETAYGWGHLTRMAVHTSVGFVLLGVGVSLLKLKKSPDSKIEVNYSSIIKVNLTLLVATISLWQALGNWEDKRIQQQINFEAKLFGSAFLYTLEPLAKALEAMSSQWEFNGGLTRDEWSASAKAYLKNFKMLQAVEWVDPSLHVRWVEPLLGNELAEGLDLSHEEERNTALVFSRDTNSLTTSNTVDLVQGGKGILLFSPLTINNDFSGFMLSVVNLRDVVDSAIGKVNGFSDNFNLKIFENGILIYGHHEQEKPTSPYEKIHSVVFKQLNWDVHVIPSEAYINSFRSPLPTWILTLGLIMTQLSSVLVYFRESNLRKEKKLQEEITKRLKTQSYLDKSLEELRLILDSAQEGIQLLDKHGMTTFANPTACALTHYSEAELCGQPFHNLIHHSRANGDIYPISQCLVHETLTRGVTQQVSDEVFWRKDGTCFFVEYTSSPVLDGQGEIIGAVVTFQDISKRIEHEEKLARHALDLERSNQDLNDFAYVASHDLKAPLRGIAQLTQWIEEDLREVLSEQTQEYFSLLQNRVMRLEKLLDDLLAYSRSGRNHGDFKSLDIEVLIKDIFSLIDPPVGFELVYKNTVPVFVTLVAPLELVLRNLISNAIKHHDKDSGFITVSVEKCDKGLSLSVEDDGPGIPPEHSDRVFNMFQTLKPRDEVEGSGMGLAIIKKIINTYSSTINVESDGIRGTKINFIWPSEELLRSYVYE